MVGCYPIFYLLQVYDVFKHVGWHQLRRICGFHHDGSDDERVATVDELCRLYIESIKLGRQVVLESCRHFASGPQEKSGQLSSQIFAHQVLKSSW